VTLSEWMLETLKPGLEGEKYSIREFMVAVKILIGELRKAGIIAKKRKVSNRVAVEYLSPDKAKLSFGDPVKFRLCKVGIVEGKFAGWARPGRKGRDRAALGYANAYYNNEMVLARLRG
jgi:hypothetical protein